jgi:hypothetical protein
MWRWQVFIEWNFSHGFNFPCLGGCKHGVAEQRVTGFLLLAGERMGTETRINLAASFMSDGRFWLISESGRPGMHGLHGKICLDDGAWWVLVRRCIHEGAWGTSKVAWGWSQAKQLSRAVLRVQKEADVRLGRSLARRSWLVVCFLLLRLAIS